jgi:hypothetical protein
MSKREVIMSKREVIAIYPWGNKMSKPKYRISEKHLETHGIKRLERDGFSREQISKALYAHTPGVSQRERTNMMKQLYDRKGEC